MSRKLSVLAGITSAAVWGWLAVANAQSAEVKQYEQLRKRLFAGERVTAIFTPDKCKSSGGGGAKTASTSSGGLAIQNFMEIGGNTLAFANQHLTLRPDGEIVLELVQYRVYTTGATTVKASFLSPLTYKPIQEARMFECQLGAGLDFRHSGS